GGRHTGCSRDWSSDVCSSDLGGARPADRRRRGRHRRVAVRGVEARSVGARGARQDCGARRSGRRARDAAQPAPAGRTGGQRKGANSMRHVMRWLIGGIVVGAVWCAGIGIAAAETAEAPDTVGAAFTVSSTLVTILLGIVAPIVTGVLVRPTNPSWVKVL